MELKETIKKGFLSYLLNHQKRPNSVFQLAQSLEIEEAIFYEYFSSLQDVERHIWIDFFENTRQKIENDEVFATYSVREKVLAFYYTFLESLKQNRSYVVFCYLQLEFWEWTPALMDKMEEKFSQFIEQLLLEARESQEIAERSLLMNIYPTIFIWQLKSILHFWVNDTSESFEKTDIYIEKSVNFTFDSLSPNLLDSAFDFLKFTFQNR